jgi:hypothetical protein
MRIQVSWFQYAFVKKQVQKFKEKEGNKMKLVIAGSRTFNDYPLLKSTLLPFTNDVTEVVSGAAAGAKTTFQSGSSMPSGSSSGGKPE